MPICTSCTTGTPFLYTLYSSNHNLRLEQCTKCLEFADPYVEQDTLVLLIDLILLKRGVYRHLLYNRGAEPRNGSQTVQKPVKQQEEKSRIPFVLRLGGPLVFLDAFIRWSHLNSGYSKMDISPWTKETLAAFLRTFVGCFAETLAFHGGIVVACYFVLLLVGNRRAPISDIRREFRFSLIPLSLFYSSLTKLFLLFLLSIWKPSPSTDTFKTSTDAWWNGTYLAMALDTFDDETMDREWIVRNILGGMSAGFGLRVILDSHPFFITIIILAGWAAKTGVAGLVGRWVGGDEAMGAVWLAYSIP
ncbi:Arv1-like family-domain-containing protein [Mycena floridula]|nr:Arv1-like family-domain-containing protein [Mycena floridula]